METAKFGHKVTCRGEKFAKNVVRHRRNCSMFTHSRHVLLCVRPKAYRIEEGLQESTFKTYSEQVQQSPKNDSVRVHLDPDQL